jgi:cytochrome c553
MRANAEQLHLSAAQKFKRAQRRFLARNVAANNDATIYLRDSRSTVPGSPKTMPRIACRIALLAAFLFTVSAHADDLKAGKALVYTCGGCHGVTGYKNAYPNYHVPRIAGQNYDYLVAALTEYKKGERAHPTMRAQGEGMSDEDIRNIAAYLSSLKP